MSRREVGLYEFLLESELQQYYGSFKNDLKVQNVGQLKWVVDDDLLAIGMSRPEVRRLQKMCAKFAGQSYLSRVRHRILGHWQTDAHDDVTGSAHRTDVSRARDHFSSDEPPSSSKHIIPSDAIVVNKELGSGEFGVVQQGVWCSDDGHRIQVAIKCLSAQRMQANPSEFLKEATILHSITHAHIVRLYGVVLDGCAMMLVTELAPLRSLLECLKEPTVRASFPVPTLCVFSEQICDGMCYLESKRLIHRDLAARNILVFSKNTVKISDFGLSRMLGVGKDYYQTNFNVNLKLPIAWCAPECINFLRFTTASDVWAFGVTLWEMFSYGFQPWPALTGQQILEAIDEPSCQRLERPDACPRDHYQLMLQCWRHAPHQRPTFTALLRQLTQTRPEQLLAVETTAECHAGGRQRVLQCAVGEVVTVLDRRADQPHTPPALWKAVTAAGRTGLIDPTQFVLYAYAQPRVQRDGASAICSWDEGRGRVRTCQSGARRRLTPQMISAPQNDLKHTGHVGPDGSQFGDLAFLSRVNKSADKSDTMPLSGGDDRLHGKKDTSDLAPLIASACDASTAVAQAEITSASCEQQCGDIAAKPAKHEYQEISGAELKSSASVTSDGCLSDAEDPFDLGPSMMDEVLSVLDGEVSTASASCYDVAGAARRRGRILSDESASGGEISNMCNEIREQGARYRHEQHSGGAATSARCTQPLLREISESDRRTLERAIAMANELAAKSMAALNAIDASEAARPRSAGSVTTAGLVKRSPFRVRDCCVASTAGGRCAGTASCRRDFSSEAARIVDVQAAVRDSERRVYDALVSEPICRAVDSRPDCSDTTVPVLAVAPTCLDKHHVKNGTFCTLAARERRECKNHSECGDEGSFVRGSETGGLQWRQRTRSVDDLCGVNKSDTSVGRHVAADKASNPLPLPPRHTGRTAGETTTVNCTAGERRRHQRKHPLVLPCRVSSTDAAAVRPVASPPAKPPRHRASSGSSLSGPPLQQRVSCEDLRQFAVDARGRSHGVASDEVRVMLKVLGGRTVASDSASEEQRRACVAALDCADWDVHRAIKLRRVQLAVGGVVSASQVTATLHRLDWSVARAVSALMVVHGSAAHATVV